jgi:hypothetical protein
VRESTVYIQNSLKLHSPAGHGVIPLYDKDWIYSGEELYRRPAELQAGALFHELTHVFIQTALSATI